MLEKHLLQIVQELSLQPRQVAAAIEVGIVSITDDGLGTNTITLSGAQASSFEVVGGKLYLKQGVVLDYETRTSLAVTITVADLALSSSTPVTTMNASLYWLRVGSISSLWPVVQDCQSMLGLWVRPYYAMTEVRPIFSFDLRKPGSPPPGSVGQLIPPTEVKIVDETGNEVSADESGELWVKGPSFSGAYYRDPQRTAEALSGEWFRTGDIVYRDQDGNYFIIGRNRDQIISGGAKIAPVEVEDAILTHPGVAAAAVIGVADPMYGQIVKAFVVRSDPHLKENDIIAHCEKRIADYKVPRVVMFMASLPVAPSGKVLKSALT